MFTKEFLEKIDQIDTKLEHAFSSMQQTHLEKVLSRLSKLTEEVGELNSDILDKFYKTHNFDEINLQGEFADVIICLALLAKKVDVDLNTAIIGKLEKIKKRGGI